MTDPSWWNEEEPPKPRTLGDLMAELRRVYELAAESGWFCRFHSRLSAADRFYLEHACGLKLDDRPDEPFLAIKDEFRPGLTLYLLRTQTEGMLEIILMPVDRMKPEQMVAASNEVMFDIVRAIGIDPPIELERYA
jgi:hypothetical protein